MSSLIHDEYQMRLSIRWLQWLRMSSFVWLLRFTSIRSKSNRKRNETKGTRLQRQNSNEPHIMLNQSFAVRILLLLLLLLLCFCCCCCWLFFFNCIRYVESKLLQAVLPQEFLSQNWMKKDNRYVDHSRQIFATCCNSRQISRIVKYSPILVLNKFAIHQKNGKLASFSIS